jgi:hypothetical protein
MQTQKLTIRLPAEDIAYLKSYARQQGITVTEALHRYLRMLRSPERGEIHPEVSRFAGLVPPDVDARQEYVRHVERRHT